MSVDEKIDMMDEQYRESAVEALILASPDPLAPRRLTQLVEGVTPSQLAKHVAKLNDGYAQRGSSFRIRQLAGGYQMYILPEYVGFIEEMLSERRRLRLSRAALETAAIVAYRQPVTKTDIENIRGVASDGVLRTLLEKKLVTVVGRANTLGKPLQYGSTDEFLKFFGLASLEDLPSIAEIEKMIAAEESRSQTELRLELDNDNQPVKLNIADGTFDPEAREGLPYGDPEVESEAAPESTKEESLELDSPEEEVTVSDSSMDSGIATAENRLPEDVRKD